MSYYAFGLLDPAKAPDGAENAAMLGAKTLGVEVTAAAYVPYCGLGNIDPQHGFGISQARAAIEAAVDWPLPDRGARIVTIRPDADALGAMAVLALRAGGNQLLPDALSRVAEIARWDCLRLGGWQDWRDLHPPLFRPAMAVDLMGKSLELKAVDALVRLPSWSIERRVDAFADWLLEGHSGLPDEAVNAALQFETGLLGAWNRGAIDVRRTDDPRMAIMMAAPDAPLGGMELAYRVAPVVIAEGHLPAGRKLTVAQFEPGWVDMPALLNELEALEPGWGGQPHSIIGSPQGKASKLGLETLVDLMKKNLLCSAQSDNIFGQLGEA